MAEARFREFVEVAVPVPLEKTFTYAVPDELSGDVAVGARVRVPFGGRILTGVVVGTGTPPPEGTAAQPISALLDDEPSVTPPILDAARFVAEYYLAPLGEVLRSALPPPLQRSGERRFSLSDRGLQELGAMTGLEREIGEALLLLGPSTCGSLRDHLRRPGLRAVLEAMRAEGRLATDDRWTDGKGTRWDRGVALREVDEAALAAALGRSAARRRVVDHLREIARPALVAEVTRATGAGPAVVKALEAAGVLSSFTQPRRYDASSGWQADGGTDERGFALTDEQQAALAAILAEPPPAVLVRGVTGSGKSEVYARALEETVRRGRRGIWLVPEIGLTPVFARQLAKRFGGRLAVLHSALSAGERSSEWRRIRAGEVDVVLGPRSAIWAPLSPLGLIVVDEEHDGSYKQEETPRYQARDLALWRGAREGAAVVLGSATPSTESLQGAREGRLVEVRLTRRVEDRPLPAVEVVDLRAETADPGDRGAIVLSRALRAAVTEALDRREQVILLLNRRGYSPHLICRGCSEDFRCTDCSVARTFHKRALLLVCHYCGARGPAPATCPTCGGEVLHPEGIGTERVLEKVLELFPGVRAARFDRDAVRRKGGISDLLDRFGRGDLDLLVGTQMIAKGHHFPNVTLTGVVSADGLLGFPDFRAGERTFQLLVQVSGRAGRGERPGRVLIQTFHPEHPAIRAAVSRDPDAFYDEELRLRKMFHFPPFTRIARVVSSSTDREAALDDIGAVATALGRRADAGGFRLLGPAPAPLEKLQGKFRFHLLLRGRNRRALRSALAEGLREVPPSRARKVDRVVDIDPVNVL